MLCLLQRPVLQLVGLNSEITECFFILAAVWDVDTGHLDTSVSGLHYIIERAGYGSLQQCKNQR